MRYFVLNQREAAVFNLILDMEMQLYYGDLEYGISRDEGMEELSRFHWSENYGYSIALTDEARMALMEGLKRKLEELEILEAESPVLRGLILKVAGW